MNESSIDLPSLDEIREAVRARQSWGIEALRQIIAINSVSPNEVKCQRALADILQAEGLPVELRELDDGSLRNTDGFIDSGLAHDNRPNLITWIGGEGERGRSLILNSHIDTVIWEETLAKWTVHPLSGDVSDGKLYGRGSMDAKGQVMTAVVAILALKDLHYDPPGKVMVQSVVGEEPDGNGTLSLCAQGVVADAAINLEATDNHIAYGHRGIVGLRYRLAGEVRHGSVRGDQANVIVQVGALAAALDASLDDWRHPSDAVYGPPTINVGRVAGGDDIFSTPFGCTLECGIRYAPETYEAILSHVSQKLQSQIVREIPDLSTVEEAVFFHADAAGISPRHPFAQAFHAAVNEIEGDRELVTFPAGCDVRHFINRYRLPAVIFGPGELALAHGENEYLNLAQWERSSQILALFVTHWCS